MTVETRVHSLTNGHIHFVSVRDASSLFLHILGLNLPLKNGGNDLLYRDFDPLLRLLLVLVLVLGDDTSESVHDAHGLGVEGAEIHALQLRGQVKSSVLILMDAHCGDEHFKPNEFGLVE